MQIELVDTNVCSAPTLFIVIEFTIDKLCLFLLDYRHYRLGFGKFVKIKIGK